MTEPGGPKPELSAPGGADPTWGAPEDPVPDHWERLAEYMGSAYLRYSFTKGTAQEVSTLIELLGLKSGMTVLDVGCGPGRHSVELARRGMRVTGVDIAEPFLEVAREQAAAAGVTELVRFERHDAKALPFRGSFDAAISLCQGGIGLGGEDPIAADRSVLQGIAAALVPEGRVAVSCFNAYFQVRWLEATDTFDADRAVNHERTEIRNEAGVPVPADLWTTCSTPRELRLLAESAGLVTEAVYAATPGAYGTNPPTVDAPEFLALLRRRDGVAALGSHSADR